VKFTEVVAHVEFRSNNATHSLVLDALDLIKRPADAPADLAARGRS
jgi:hypothetical protein